MSGDRILIGHGSGGRLSQSLIRELFIETFGNSQPEALPDAAVFESPGQNLAFTTDSFVVDPIFFPGGDIGKLAVSGTVNDLATCGAVPQYLSCGFILEEGLEINQLRLIVKSMKEEAVRAGVQIITGDTKVVKRAQADKLFINTSGIGFVSKERIHLNHRENFRAGDKVILSGFTGDHAMAILSAREKLKLDEEILSDVAPLNKLVERALINPDAVKAIRDVTRGGLATVLNELCEALPLGIKIEETAVPVRQSVLAMCEIYGFDPLYLANEGKMVFIVDQSEADSILTKIQNDALGKDAAIIGELTHEMPGKVTMQSIIGGTRIVDMLNSEMLPRIC